MAKKSAIQRNKKRVHLVNRYAKKRTALKKVLSDPNVSEDEFYKAQAKLSKLPKKFVSSSLGKSLYSYG